jgi:transposase
MSCFPSARHLASWAGQCPGNDKSAGKRRSGKTRNGSKWLDFALEEAAMAAIRVKRHYLEAQYRRLKPRRGHKRALGAVKHSILNAIWHMLSTGETYRDLGGDFFTNRDPERQTAPRQTAPTPRTPRHVDRGGRGSLSELFLPDHMGVSSGGWWRLMVDAPR